jgi:hypothetical protein
MSPRFPTWLKKIEILVVILVALVVMGIYIFRPLGRAKEEEPSGPLSIVVRGTLKAVGTPKSQIWFT